MNANFKNLTLKPELQKSLETLQFIQMTEVQNKCLPLIFEGKDIIAKAKTGSGKTAAFGLGILNTIEANRKTLHALVLCPTRELAEQVALDIRKLSSALHNVKIQTLCGGVAEANQVESLKAGSNIVVGTPGRVLHLLKKKSLKLIDLNFFVLDEADRMLDMGFTDEITEIFDYLPEKKQSLLFSATYPENIQKLSSKILKDAVVVDVNNELNQNDIDDSFYELRPTQDKNNLLYKLLSQYKPDRALVFCRTKKETQDVSDFLDGRGVFVDCLNGDLEQRDRTAVFTKFSNRSLSVLVATDIAARGLDIKDLACVVNYNMPSKAEDYVHRIGRTGRAGKKGLAFSFYTKEESFRLEEIEELTAKKCKISDPTELSYSEKYNLKPPMKTLYISGGKKEKLRPGDIVGALTGVANINSKDIGDISIQQFFSFVAIKSHSAKKAVDRLSVGRIKKKKYKVGFA